MLAEDGRAFMKWLAAFGKHFESNDANALAALFSPDVVFHASPFDAPLRGRDALERHFAQMLGSRHSLSFTAEVVKSAPEASWAHWACGFIRAGTDDPVRQEGIIKAGFDGAGVCSELKQWWNSIEPGQSDLMRDTDA